MEGRKGKGQGKEGKQDGRHYVETRFSYLCFVLTVPHLNQSKCVQRLDEHATPRGRLHNSKGKV